MPIRKPRAAGGRCVEAPPLSDAARAALLQHLGGAGRGILESLESRALVLLTAVVAEWDMAVMRLGARCELESEAPGQATFRVSEYAVLDDGTEVVLHSARGFSTTVHGSVGVWHHMTAARIERDVMTVVLPEDAEKTGEDHPWEWLVSLLAHAGVTETVDHLRGVPYEVRIAPDVTSRLQPGDT